MPVWLARRLWLFSSLCRLTVFSRPFPSSPPGRLAGVLRLTIAFLPVERLWPTRFEASLDRGVVGEPEPQAVAGKLAPLGRPGSWRFNDLEIASEQVVDRARVGRAVEAKTLAQQLEGAEIFGRPQVEIAAEEQRRVPGPPGRHLCGAQDVGSRQV